MNHEGSGFHEGSGRNPRKKSEKSTAERKFQDHSKRTPPRVEVQNGHNFKVFSTRTRVPAGTLTKPGTLAKKR